MRCRELSSWQAKKAHQFLDAPHWGSLGINGEGGIRTLETRKGLTVFETAPFNRSGTSPEKPGENLRPSRETQKLFDQLRPGAQKLVAKQVEDQKQKTFFHLPAQDKIRKS